MKVPTIHRNKRVCVCVCACVRVCVCVTFQRSTVWNVSSIDTRVFQQPAGTEKSFHLLKDHTTFCNFLNWFLSTGVQTVDEPAENLGRG